MHKKPWALVIGNGSAMGCNAMDRVTCRSVFPAEGRALASWPWLRAGNVAGAGLGRGSAPDKEAASARNGVDDVVGKSWGQCGASLAPAQAAAAADVGGVGVVGGVDHDGAVAGLVVEALFQSVESQAVAVFALVGFGGAEGSQAAHQRAWAVAEAVGANGSRVAAVGNVALVQQDPACQVDHKQALLR